jgi:hypothetical protein
MRENSAVWCSFLAEVADSLFGGQGGKLAVVWPA